MPSGYVKRLARAPVIEPDRQQATKEIEPPAPVEQAQPPTNLPPHPRSLLSRIANPQVPIRRRSQSPGHRGKDKRSKVPRIDRPRSRFPRNGLYRLATPSAWPERPLLNRIDSRPQRRLSRPSLWSMRSLPRDPPPRSPLRRMTNTRAPMRPKRGPHRNNKRFSNSGIRRVRHRPRRSASCRPAMSSA